MGPGGEVERAEERLRVLTAAMRAFAEATTDLGHLLDLVARNVAEVLGDACVLLVLTEDGERLAPTAAHAADPEALARVHALVKTDPFLLRTHPAARAVLETRRPMLAPVLDAAAMRGLQTTSAYAAFQKEQGIHSLLAVALHAHGRPLGLLTLTRYRPTSPPFDEHDQELASNLADHASLAIVNARLYVAEHTARLAAEEASAERVVAARFRVVLDAAPDAIIVTDARKRITFVNGQAERLVGYSRDELQGAALDLVVPERGQGDPAETVGRRRDGSEFPVEITESVLTTDEGPLTVSALRDVTKRRRAEKAALQAKAVADAANLELESFGYTVAHDLRAPLRAMNGFAQILLADHASQLDEAGRELLDRIARGGQKMSALVDGLLGLSRLNRRQPKREAVDLSAAVRASLAQALDEAGSSRSPTEVVVEDGLQVNADSTLLLAMVDNLVANAVKFTAHTPNPRIELGRLEQDGEDVFFLRDNGAGFDMEFSNKLFVPFQRLHRLEDFAGTGIGLATVKRIVARHEGRIWAEGRVGAGATFYFTLPGASAIPGRR